MSSAALLRAMLDVEQAWLDALVTAGVAPAAARVEVTSLAGAGDVATLAQAAVATGTPVSGLVALLRERAESRGEVEAARWLHRGLTSQDVVDTALVLCLREAAARIARALDEQVASLAHLVRAHVSTPMLGRTLTQAATPTTFGLVASGWLAAVLDAADDLAAATRRGWPIQAGGAVGTSAALLELCAGERDRAAAVLAHAADALELRLVTPWHTVRTPITRAGDALVRCADAWGLLAGDVLLLGSTDVGEVTEADGGGSSTMPHKSNPVRATLLRRLALTAPGLASTLHVAAGQQASQRAPGAWHAEAAVLADLARQVAAGAELATALVGSLEIHPDVMRAHLDATAGVDSEQRVMAGLVGRSPGGAEGYLGLAEHACAQILDRATAPEVPS
ncbi:3-carboxy-cis,cis-muconate cycloisomerase [Nocardioides sp. CBS4Y-1]|uniref:3-carboxy-cis,cis-muconate cycloisomerase n=2 Tax=Nocardioides acrostichi TaxID=2784339 RepID=A0A930YCC1_9ACTN|nr:3-carboxy-cis,cis-muconate cycloisomerase [Nocardioides acrostichi]